VGGKTLTQVNHRNEIENCLIERSSVSIRSNSVTGWKYGRTGLSCRLCLASSANSRQMVNRNNRVCIAVSCYTKTTTAGTCIHKQFRIKNTGRVTALFIRFSSIPTTNKNIAKLTIVVVYSFIENSQCRMSSLAQRTLPNCRLLLTDVCHADPSAQPDAGLRQPIRADHPTVCPQLASVCLSGGSLLTEPKRYIQSSLF